MKWFAFAEFYEDLALLRAHCIAFAYELLLCGKYLKHEYTVNSDEYAYDVLHFHVLQFGP